MRTEAMMQCIFIKGRVLYRFLRMLQIVWLKTRDIKCFDVDIFGKCYFGIFTV